MKTLLIVAGLMALTGPAAAQNATPPAPSDQRPGPVDVQPDWRRRISADDLKGVWPAAALAQGLSGEAVIECKVSLEGTLFDCFVVSESPAGAGFGHAALAIAPQALMTPAMKDGKPVVAVVRLPITFKWPYGRPDRPVQSIPLLGNLAWVAAPTYDQAVAAFPAKARETSTPGHVVLFCQIRVNHAPDDCRTATEEPKGLGFGKAARDLASIFRAPATAADGASTVGRVTQLSFTFPISMLGSARRIGKAQWVTLPSAEDLAAAQKNGSLTGLATMDCVVSEGGRLKDCQVPPSVDPALGAAELSLADKISLSIWTAEGLPVIGGRVQIPIRFAGQ